jgi:hypothetical protein
VKTLSYNPKAKLAATSLVLVLVVSAAGIVLVSGIMSWISTNTDLTLRINRFRTTAAAGGAATEKVVGQILSDFQLGGIATVSNNLASYTAIVPSDQDLVGAVTDILDPVTGILDPILGILEPSPSPTPVPQPAPEPDTTSDWSGYEFSDGKGNSKKSQVAPVSPWTYSQLTSQFNGLGAYSATYRLTSSVRDSGHKHKTLAGVQQDVVLASIPVFGFHVFYAPELEICPATAMTLGRVHANKNIYCQPAGTLTFAAPVTTAQRIIHDKHAADPTPRTPGPIISQADREGGVSTLLPALGTNRSLAGLRQIIERPPSTESRTSALGRQRLHNKADLIIRISNSGVVAHSGADDNFATVIPWSEVGETVDVALGKSKGIGLLKKDDDKDKDKDKGASTNITHGLINTNVVFFNLRESKTIYATEIDISQLLAKTNFVSVLGRPVRTLYVIDSRTYPGGAWQTGVRVVNGHTLPATGLTIVTPNPLYIWGSYNSPTNAQPAPAALMGDAITILSPAWQDINSASPDLTKRVAANSTVNAALLCGIVPTGGGYYSGGLENLPRLLEDWTGKTLTIKGSLVAFFHSAIATAPWGADDGYVYRPPQRNWSHDTRMNTLAGLPPSTPELRTAFRRSWQSVVASR